ncbi:hypothetical protein ACP275_09G021700 [Erythranthe tilingii]
MIKGEGAEEKPISAFSSPSDPPDDRESDGGDELSDYSSCGGESEFDRYCSANSAMGTPSFGGSSFHESDFGSLKSFKLGAENTNLKNSGVERVLYGYRGESESGSCSGRGDEFSIDGKDKGMLNLSLSNVDFKRNFSLENNWGNKDVIGNSEGSATISGDFPQIEDVGSVERGFDVREELENDGGECRNLSNEDGASSKYEHSDGDDSMFGCGSDDERNTNTYFGNNLPFRGEESVRKENQLTMNSAVAFGADDWDDFLEESRENSIGSMVWDGIRSERQTGIGSLSYTSDKSVANPNIIFEGRESEVKSTPAASNQVGASCKSAETNVSALSTNSTNVVKLDVVSEDGKGVLASNNQVSDIDELNEYLGYSPGHNIFQIDVDPLKKEASANELSRTVGTELEMDIQDTPTSEITAIRQDILLRNGNLDETKIELDPVSESVENLHIVVPGTSKEDKEAKLFGDALVDTTTSDTTKKKFYSAFDQIDDHFVPVKTRDFDLNDLYDEIVNDMEDILLDSVESPVSRFSHGSKIYQRQFTRPSRDGGSSASTSGTDHAYNWIDQPLRIDKIEVVGTRQKKGEVSFSERLVGIQKYTVYKIRVWSGEEHWEVERRYRDFSILYYRLKKLFADHGWTLPSPWSSVERESRKLFGNASPDVVADRKVLIEECLQSVIHPKFSSSSLNALVCFLSSSEVPDSLESDKNLTQSPVLNRGPQMENLSTLGKTISLDVEIHPLKPTKQMLDAQHYRCAGCYRNFDDGVTRVQEFVQALGWGKPRLCEYSGQLFCSSCHNNDTAVLPARVLHYWDFTRYPVSQLAKSFLDSINDQPMLCVSAVNPFLFSKVPTLQHVANIRNRIRAMLPYVRCPFRRSIYKGLGSRRYLLDSNDFFALKDLIDLSKGVFAALPVMVETVSRKILEHITEQCLVCYDVGIPCSARQDCITPLYLIFPFQEGEVEKCRSCESVFHKDCFKKLATCPCGARFKKDEMKQSLNNEIIHNNVDSNLNLTGGTSEPSSGLLAGLFSKVVSGRFQNLRNEESKDNVILMGSLPNTSL